MDSGLIVGVFVLGMAVGALLEAGVRLAFRDRIQRRFVEAFREEMQSAEAMPVQSGGKLSPVSRTNAAAEKDLPEGSHRQVTETKADSNRRAQQ